jgi:hypothetical protein
MTKFNKDLFRHSKVDRGDAQTDTHTEYGDLISLLLFFQNKESRLKRRAVKWKFKPEMTSRE